MKIHSLELEGFQSYYDKVHLDLDGLRQVAIIGPNGAGKSTLLDAIEFALYGKYRGDVVGSLLARGAKQASVTLEFSLGDDRFQITRIRTSSGRHEVYFKIASAASQTGWKELTEKHSGTADPEIVERLGMTATSARATWIIAQNDFGTFCELQPAPRRALLATTFGLDRFAELASKAKERVSQVREQLAQDEAALHGLRSRLDRLDTYDGPLADKSDVDLKALADAADETASRVATALAQVMDSQDAEQQHATARQALDTYTQGFTERANHYQSTKVRLERAVQVARQSLSKAETDHAAAESAVWAVDDLAAAHTRAQAETQRAEEALNAIREQKHAHGTTVAALRAEQESIKATGNEINERVRTLNASLAKGEGHCFTCGQELSEQDTRDLIGRQKARKDELLEKYQERGQSVTECQTAISAAEQDIKQHEASLARARRAERDVEQELNTKRTLADTQSQAEQALSDARAAVEAATTELSEQGEPPAGPDPERLTALQQSVTKAAQAVQSAQDAARERERLRAERDQARKDERAVWAEQERRIAATKEREEIAEPLQAAEDKVAEARSDLTHYEALRAAFQPSGIPALMLNGIVEEVNAEANSILESLGGELGVNVSTSREKKSGGVEEKIFVMADTPSGQVDYSTLSGAEKFRVALSIRCGMARCLARRTGVPMQTIILDEGWGALDEDTRRAVQEMLGRLSTEFTIYTVSHIEEIKDSFPTVIEVSKDSGTSVATVVQR